MRSLAHDLGLALGCGAYLKDLVRSAYGPFSISEATAPDTLEKAGLEDLTTYLYQADFPLLDWPACTLTDIQSRDVTCGKDMLITCATGRDTSYCRAYNAAGRFIAVLRYEQSTGLWHPDKVLA
jgi:tRNA pseudouridine55 synthase